MSQLLAIRKESCLERQMTKQRSETQGLGEAGGPHSWRRRGNGGGLGSARREQPAQVGSQVKRFAVGCSQPGALQETYRRASEEKDAAIM